MVDKIGRLYPETGREIKGTMGKSPLFTDPKNRYTLLMKKNIIFWAIMFVSLVLWGCKGKSSPSNKENFDDDASYALGINIVSNLAADGIIPNSKQFMKGLNDALSGGKTRFTKEEALEIIQTAYSTIYYTMMEENGKVSMQEGIDFLVENGKKSGVITTSSGLQYEVITEGNGAKPSASDEVRVHYEGRLTDGTVFDSSYGGDPIEFPLNRVIPGWAEGVQLMKVGSKYKLYIPSELGYGGNVGGPIPPYSVLIFEVELLDILK
jgi:FKBP-type peptidyl-prolyl cis-trans isomerase